MGIVHSMDEGQVSRVSTALRQSAESIQGINRNFDVVDEHWRGVQAFNTKINSKVEETIGSFQKLDETINARIRAALDTMKGATDELTQVMEGMVYALQEFDVRSEMNQLPKAVIPFMVPLIILMIELAIANAYLGILLTRLPDVSEKYSTYLLANAATVLLGLTLSLLWLGSYRGWLSWKTRRARRAYGTPEERRLKRWGSQEPQAEFNSEGSGGVAAVGSGRTSNVGGAVDNGGGGTFEVDKDRRERGTLRAASTQAIQAELIRRLSSHGSQENEEEGGGPPKVADAGRFGASAGPPPQQQQQAPAPAKLEGVAWRANADAAGELVVLGPSGPRVGGPPDLEVCGDRTAVVLQPVVRFHPSVAAAAPPGPSSSAPSSRALGAVPSPAAANAPDRAPATGSHSHDRAPAAARSAAASPARGAPTATDPLPPPSGSPPGAGVGVGIDDAGAGDAASSTPAAVPKKKSGPRVFWNSPFEAQVVWGAARSPAGGSAGPTQ